MKVVDRATLRMLSTLLEHLRKLVARIVLPAASTPSIATRCAVATTAASFSSAFSRSTTYS
jgi:hypothetical protein